MAVAQADAGIETGEINFEKEATAVTVHSGRKRIAVKYDVTVDPAGGPLEILDGGV
jgi:hypothetical protein